MSKPYRLKEMSALEAREMLAERPWLIIPSGTTEPHGPHLPLGCDTLILERLADDLSARFRIIRAPAVEYGVNAAGLRAYPGSAGLRRKTLHRVMNELIEAWEEGARISEFVILTAQGVEAHQEALSTIRVAKARVQVVDIFGIDLQAFQAEPMAPVHGGELDTSLLLYLAPDTVRMGAATDYLPTAKALARYRRGGSGSLPRESPGSVVYPKLASAQKGQEVYRFILERIAGRCFPFAGGISE